MSREFKKTPPGVVLQQCGEMGGKASIHSPTLEMPGDNQHAAWLGRLRILQLLNLSCLMESHTVGN